MDYILFHIGFDLEKFFDKYFHQLVMYNPDIKWVLISNFKNNHEPIIFKLQVGELYNNTSFSVVLFSLPFLLS